MPLVPNILVFEGLALADMSQETPPKLRPWDSQRRPQASSCPRQRQFEKCDGSSVSLGFTQESGNIGCAAAVMEPWTTCSWGTQLITSISISQTWSGLWRTDSPNTSLEDFVFSLRGYRGPIGIIAGVLLYPGFPPNEAAAPEPFLDSLAGPRQPSGLVHPRYS